MQKEPITILRIFYKPFEGSKDVVSGGVFVGVGLVFSEDENVLGVEGVGA
jgi:hypothetical protein